MNAQDSTELVQTKAELADEATSALDPNLSLAIHETLLKNPDVAVIEVAHKISPKEKAMFNKIVHLDMSEGSKNKNN